ncbi:MAG: PH domain-containing protein [Bacillus sp. (in: Bacteria)]|nr:PH domain-containing protein [Bacillus sp. (in: firmicutes)]
MSESKRLHPIVIVLTISKRIKDLLFTFIALFFIGNRGDGGKLFLFGGAAIVFVVIIITSIFSWLRYTYKLEQDELRIEYGVFIRKKRYIPLERIQSLDVSEGVLQRLFGMVKVKVETAGGSGSDEAEAVLSAISKQEARIIQEHVAAAKKSGTNEMEDLQENSPIYKISTKNLVGLSLTSGGVGVVLSAVFALFSQLDDFIPYQRLFGGVQKWAAVNLLIIAIIVFFGFFLAWVLALIGTMLKYANFTVIKTENDLVISQGLLERRQITIPLKRIQAIRINENIVRQLLGYASVYVESAGGSSENMEGSKVMLFPMVKLKNIAQIIESHLPGYVLPPSFTPVPKRALRRYILRSWYLFVPLVIVSLVLFTVWGLLSLILLALVTIGAILKYKSAGWSIDTQQLTLRYRTFIRTTVMIRKSKIQSLEMRESYFQRKRQLGTLEAFVKSGAGGAGGAVVDIDKEDIKQIYDWYSREKKNRDS